MFKSLLDTVEGPESRQMRRNAYALVADEIEAGLKQKGLWAKALADGDFDEREASKLYLKYRVDQIVDEAKISLRKTANKKVNRYYVDKIDDLNLSEPKLPYHRSVLTIFKVIVSLFVISFLVSLFQ